MSSFVKNNFLQLSVVRNIFSFFRKQALTADEYYQKMLPGVVCLLSEKNF